MSSAFKNDPALGNANVYEPLSEIIFNMKVILFNDVGTAVLKGFSWDSAMWCSLALKTQGTQELQYVILI